MQSQSAIKECYIFGKGRLGKRLYDVFTQRGIRILGYVDNNAADAIKPTEVSDKNAAIAVASINYMYEIENQLEKNGFTNIFSFAKLTEIFDELKDFNDSYNGLREDYTKNKELYYDLYKILADEKSKTVLDTIIEYRKTLKTSLYSTICDDIDKQYFEDFMPRNSKVFVDGGGFDGDTVQRYLKYCTKPEKIYFFEPDIQSIEKAKKNLENFKNIEYLNCGVSDKSEYLSFDSRNDFGSLFSINGTKKVQCTAIDDIVKENKAFIKLDVEGFEIAALKGAERLIKNNSPLAICVYHKPQDIWQIPKLIQKINKTKSYKFYLRHYTNSIFDTIMYGVPIDD